MSRDMFGNDLTKGDSFGTPRTATIELCEDHNEPICSECGYCVADPEHIKHQQPPSVAGVATALVSSIPWRAEGRKIYDNQQRLIAETLTIHRYENGKESTDDYEAWNNARLVVTAVNNYEGLVAALEACVNLLAVATGIDGKSLYASPVRQRATDALNRVRQER